MKLSTKIVVALFCLFGISLGFFASGVVMSIFASSLPMLQQYSIIAIDIAVVLFALLLSAMVPCGICFVYLVDKEWEDEGWL